MSTLVAILFVPMFFLHGAFGIALLSWWFSRHQNREMKLFGWGLAGYALSMTIWAYMVMQKPNDVGVYMLVSVIPFLLAHLFFAKVADTKFSKHGHFFLVTGALLVITFVVRTFLQESDPYFSEEGLLVFGVQDIPVALYIAVMTISFLPAIRVVVPNIAKQHRPIFSVCLTALFVTAITFVSARTTQLLIINGAVLSFMLLVLWSSVLTLKVK